METELHETFSRIRSIRRAGRKGAFRIARRDQAARSGIPKALRCEPAQARAEAEGQALRLGPRGSVALDGFRLFLLHLAGKLGIREALAYDLANKVVKAVCVRHRQPVVIPERLFVQISKQVEWLYRSEEHTSELQSLRH